MNHNERPWSLISERLFSHLALSRNKSVPKQGAKNILPLAAPFTVFAATTSHINTQMPVNTCQCQSKDVAVLWATYTCEDLEKGKLEFFSDRYGKKCEHA
jgi:hypothetical protein